MQQQQNSLIPATRKIVSVEFCILDQKTADQHKSVQILNHDQTPQTAGSLFDLGLGAPGDRQSCNTCKNFKNKCTGHYGLFEVNYPYIIPQYSNKVNNILKFICFTQACKNKYIPDGKKCQDCQVPSATVQRSANFGIHLNHGGRITVLSPVNVYELFKSLPVTDTMKQFGIAYHPVELLSKYIIVSSTVIRPEKKMLSQFKNNDQTTAFLSNLIKIGSNLNKITNTDATFQDIYKNFNIFMRAMQTGDPQADAKSEMKKKCNSSDFQSKRGLIRGNILGKKITRIGRATIVCDNDIQFNQITIPKRFAEVLTTVETVMPYNIDKLTMFYNNGNLYPGAKYVEDKQGNRYDIAKRGKTPLSIGEKLHRHLVDSDYVLVNRQPSLWLGSIGGHKIKISEDENCTTFGLNVGACAPYAADFDGDVINIMAVNSQQSKQEVKYLCDMSNRIINLKSNALSLAQTQDSVIGGYLLTQDEIFMDRIFVTRLHNSTSKFVNIKDLGQLISGKKALSLALPNISYVGNNSFYKKDLEKHIIYKPTDKQLKIELGEIKQGYFDSISNQVFQLIALSFKPKEALEYLYYVQQCIIKFNTYHGLSISARDVQMSELSKKTMQDKKDKIMQMCYDYTYQYLTDTLTVPIEKQKLEHLIDSVHSASFDSCASEIVSSARIKENKIHNSLILMAITGSKGSFENLKAVSGFYGAVEVDNNPLKHEMAGRLTMFHKKNDLDPSCLGLVMNSYSQGLSPSELIMSSTYSRFTLLTKVISVAKAGAYGRKIIRNLDCLNVLYQRFVQKRQQITQFLFGNDGFKVESMYPYKIPYILQSDTDIKKQIRSQISFKLDKENEQMVQLYEEQVINFVTQYKFNIFRNQISNQSQPFSDQIKVPITIITMINTEIHNLNQAKKLEEKSENLNKNISKLLGFIQNLPYIYFNTRIIQNKNQVIPSLYKSAIYDVQLTLITAIDLRIMALLPYDPFEFLLSKIYAQLSKNLLPYGTPVGITSGQCFQEYLSQGMLSSIHALGGKKVQRSGIDRLLEIFTNKTPEKLQIQPNIFIPLCQGITKQTAESIANQIKIIQLGQLAKQYSLQFDIPIKKNLQGQIPSIPEQFTKWSISIELDKTLMYINQISVQEICRALSDKDIFVYQTQQINNIECYIGDKYHFSNPLELKEILTKILNYSLRGIETITYTTLKIEKRMHIDINTKEMQEQDRFVIVAFGSNLRDIFRLRKKYQAQIEFEQIYCDNPKMMLKWFGKIAAYRKVVDEISLVVASKGGLSVNIKHIQLIASEMVQTGILTQIETSGMRQRNPKNDLLQLSESKPAVVMFAASIKNKKSYLEATNDNVIMSQVPKIGSELVEIFMDIEQVQNLSKTQSQQQISVEDFQLD